MDPCCWVALNQYQPQSNPYNSQLFQRSGWMPPNPFTQSQYVLEHYSPNPECYCCGNSSPIAYTVSPTTYAGRGCCGQ